MLYFVKINHLVYSLFVNTALAVSDDHMTHIISLQVNNDSRPWGQSRVEYYVVELHDLTVLAEQGWV
jgi:hypothetical protein